MAARNRYSLSQHVYAWLVHAFTMSGVLWALLALAALNQGDIKGVWLWLGVALIVDGLDGTLARHARVKAVVPWFDGVVLDLVVDYLTWTFIPAAFIALYVNVGGEPWGFVWAAIICLSSMFCFCNTGMKSADNYFVGFPAAWNIVAVSLWLLQTPAWANVTVILICAVLSFIPWKYLHPFRVKELMPFNIISVTLWIAVTGWAVAADRELPLWAYLVWWGSAAWVIGVSAIRTVRGRILAAD
ncbi:CDP-alcohol phosphatidyltransferase family protein [Dermabacteraceae bacterium P9123]